MEHQFFIRQQNLKLYRSLVAASEAAAAKADARQEKLLKLLAEEVANEPIAQISIGDFFIHEVEGRVVRPPCD
jgi:hypothetical protein